MSERPAASAARARVGLIALALSVSLLGAWAGWWSRVLPRIGAWPVDGLELRLERVEWLEDQMQHGRVYGMPESMMPGMPPHGVQRLTVGLSLKNTGDRPRTFRSEEIRVALDSRGVQADSRSWGPVATELPVIELGPGQIVNAVLHFDVEDTERALRLVWLRDGRVAESPIRSQPFHDHGDTPLTEWPADVEELPEGRASMGMRLFAVRYNCAGCHGHPLVPGSNTMAPHLGAIGHRASTRVPGVAAAQYLYESITDPSGFLVPECVGEQPCDEFSAMPDFSGALGLQEMADLVAYLVEQRGT